MRLKVFALIYQQLKFQIPNISVIRKWSNVSRDELFAWPVLLHTFNNNKLSNPKSKGRFSKPVTFSETIPD